MLRGGLAIPTRNNRKSVHALQSEVGEAGLSTPGGAAVGNEDVGVSSPAVLGKGRLGSFDSDSRSAVGYSDEVTVLLGREGGALIFLITKLWVECEWLVV